MCHPSFRHLITVRLLFLIGCCALGFLDSSARYIPLEESDFAQDGRDISIFSSQTAAADHLSEIGTDPIEGIWEYPTDETSLLILRSRSQKGNYDIYLYDSVDCRFSIGMRVGKAIASADPLQFSVSLCSRLRKDFLTSPIPCAGRLSAKGEILYLQSPKIKLSLTPSILLPSLWNALRLSTRIRTENPAGKLPVGLRKRLPTFDGNPPPKSSVRYL